MEEQKVIARNLKSFREASKFTQENVAQFLGIQRSAYANYETGDRLCPILIMEKLADLYGCELDELYQEDEESMKNVLVTAFRMDDATPEDMVQIARFKRFVKNYLLVDKLLKE